MSQFHPSRRSYAERSARRRGVALFGLVLLTAGCGGDAPSGDTTGDGTVEAPAPPPPPIDLETATFVVTAPVDGDSELFLVEGRGDTEWTRLTRSPGLDHDAKWIPGRRSIVFHSARDGSDPGELDLYLLDVAADFADEETLRMRENDAVRLTDAAGPDYLPAVDPTGTVVAFVSRRAEAGEATTTSGHVYELRLPELDNGAGTGAESTPIPAANRRTLAPIAVSLPPEWSPDGREIFFVRRVEAGTEIRAMPAMGRGERLIHADADFNYSPVMSEDGQWLAYTAEDSVAARVVLMRPDGSERRVVTESGRLYVDQWLPDGSALIVTSWDPDAQRTDAMLLSLEDGSVERLFTGIDRPTTGPALRIR